jgi:hypothetical protein
MEKLFGGKPDGPSVRAFSAGAVNLSGRRFGLPAEES